jgi:hypothetical protein
MGHLTANETTLRLCLFMEGQVPNDALPTEPSGPAATGSLNIGAVSELENNGYRVGRCAPRFLRLYIHHGWQPGESRRRHRRDRHALAISVRTAGHLDRLPNANNAGEAKPMDARLVISATTPIDIISGSAEAVYRAAIGVVAIGGLCRAYWTAALVGGVLAACRVG